MRPHRQRARRLAVAACVLAVAGLRHTSTIASTTIIVPRLRARCLRPSSTVDIDHSGCTSAPVGSHPGRHRSRRRVCDRRAVLTPGRNQQAGSKRSPQSALPSGKPAPHQRRRRRRRVGGHRRRPNPRSGPGSRRLSLRRARTGRARRSHRPDRPQLQAGRSVTANRHGGRSPSPTGRTLAGRVGPDEHRPPDQSPPRCRRARSRRRGRARRHQRRPHPYRPPPQPGRHRTTAVADIPPAMLALYRQAGTTICPTMPWQILAAIGTIESANGQSNLPGVHSGHNPAGAKDPLQFEPATFAQYNTPDPDRRRQPPRHLRPSRRPSLPPPACSAPTARQPATPKVPFTPTTTVLPTSRGCGIWPSLRHGRRRLPPTLGSTAVSFVQPPPGVTPSATSTRSSPSPYLPVGRPLSVGRHHPRGRSGLLRAGPALLPGRRHQPAAPATPSELWQSLSP